jgi:hypothetical protein
MLALAFDLDPVTWDAIAAIVGVLVLVANALVATSALRAAKAAEHQVEIAARALETQSRAALRVLQENGRAQLFFHSGIQYEESHISLWLHNTGAAPAEIVSSTIRLPTDKNVRGEPAEDGIVPANGGECHLVFPIADMTLRETLHLEASVINVQFREPGYSNDRLFQLGFRPFLDDYNGLALMSGQPFMLGEE